MKINGGINIEIGELSDKYELRSFVLREKLGGDISEGEFVATFSQDNATIDFYELTIKISDDTGYQCTINGYAYSVKYDVISMTIKFICAKPDFIKENIVKSYDSVLDAINSNWDGELDYKSGSDIECQIHQRAETGYQLVSKLIKGLRYKSAYGFRCDGIIIRDLDDNYDFDLGEQGFSVSMDGMRISKSKVKELEVKSEDLSVSTSLSYSKVFRQVRSEYVDLYKNYFVNNALFKILGTYRIPIKYTRFESGLKIGNLVKIQLRDMALQKFVVYSKVLSWEQGKGVSTLIELMGYDWEGS